MSFSGLRSSYSHLGPQDMLVGTCFSAYRAEIFVAHLPSPRFYFLNVYFFGRETERDSARGGGAEREGDAESEAGSRLRAISTEPHVGLEPTNCEIGS